MNILRRMEVGRPYTVYIHVVYVIRGLGSRSSLHVVGTNGDRSILVFAELSGVKSHVSDGAEWVTYVMTQRGLMSYSMNLQTGQWGWDQHDSLDRRMP